MDFSQYVGYRLKTEAKDVVGAINELHDKEPGGGGKLYPEMGNNTDGAIHQKGTSNYLLDIMKAGLGTDTIPDPWDPWTPTDPSDPSGPSDPSTPGVPYTLQMYPDLESIETINRWTKTTTTDLTDSWTCDRDGYVQLRGGANAAPNAGGTTISLRINNVDVNMLTNSNPLTTGAVSQHRTLGVYPVRKGDIVSYVRDATGTTPITCFFIPPAWKYIDIETQEVVGEPTPIIDWVVEEKHSAENNEWSYKKYASGRWEGTCIAAWSGVPITQGPASGVYYSDYYHPPALPDGVTVTQYGGESTSGWLSVTGRLISNGDVLWTSPGAQTVATSGFVTFQYNVVGTWPSPVQPIKLLDIGGGSGTNIYVQSMLEKVPDYANRNTTSKWAGTDTWTVEEDGWAQTFVRATANPAQSTMTIHIWINDTYAQSITLQVSTTSGATGTRAIHRVHKGDVIRYTVHSGTVGTVECYFIPEKEQQPGEALAPALPYIVDAVKDSLELGGGTGGGTSISIQNGLNYTDEIQYTGTKWFGKKVYRKTMNAGAFPTAAGSKNVPHNVTGIDMFVAAECIGIPADSSAAVPIPYAASTLGTFYLNKTHITFNATGTGLSHLVNTYMTMYFTYTVEPEDPPSPFTKALVPQMDMVRDVSKSQVLQSGDEWPAFTVTKAGYYSFRPTIAATGGGNLNGIMKINAHPTSNPAPANQDRISISSASVQRAMQSAWEYCDVGDVLTFEFEGTISVMSMLYYSPPKWIKSGFDADLVTSTEIVQEGLIDYSTAEQWTGQRDRDGKKIYQRTYEIPGTLPNTGQISWPHNIPNFLRLKGHFGVISNGTIDLTLPSADDNVFRNGANLVFATTSARSTYTAFKEVTIQYTCTDR